MTLLSCGNSESVRRCDARCYDAKETGCACCCGGRNHGVGEVAAVDNTRELARTWIERFANERGIQVGDLDVYLAPAVQQTSLFAGIGL